MDEYLDIVDEKGMLTGEKELRSVVHDKGLWHQTAHIYFYKKQGNNIRLLAHLRSKSKDLHPNKWLTCFGGHLESGQGYDSAAEREVQEETGIKLSVSQFIKGGKRAYDMGNNKEVTQDYYYNFQGNKNDIAFNEKEVQELKWMDSEAIKRAMILNPDSWVEKSDGLSVVMHDLVYRLS